MSMVEIATSPNLLGNTQRVEKILKQRPHIFSTIQLHHLASRICPPGWFVQHKQCVTLEEWSVPRPDLAIVRGVINDYRLKPPSASDLGLIVEVSEFSLPFDSGEVLEAYAKEAIPYYWIVNIPRNRIDVYSQPMGASATPTYGECRSYLPGEDIPLILDSREVGRIAVSGVF